MRVRASLVRTRDRQPPLFPAQPISSSHPSPLHWNRIRIQRPNDYQTQWPVTQVVTWGCSARAAIRAAHAHLEHTPTIAQPPAPALLPPATHLTTHDSLTTSRLLPNDFTTPHKLTQLAALLPADTYLLARQVFLTTPRSTLPSARSIAGMWCDNCLLLFPLRGGASALS